MEVIKQGQLVAVPSIRTAGKWWVTTEDSVAMYILGYVHHIDSGFIAWQVQMVQGRRKAFYLGEAETLPDALNYYKGL